MSLESHDKLQDKLFQARLRNRTSSLLKLLNRCVQIDERLTESLRALYEIDREISVVEDASDTEINLLRMDALRQLEEFHSKITRDAEGHQKDARILVAYSFNHFWERVYERLRELVTARDQSMSQLTEKLDRNIQAVILSHTQVRQEYFNRIDKLRARLDEKEKILSRERSRLAYIRRKNNTVIGPFEAQQSDIALMETRLAHHRTEILPQLEPLKRKYMELKKQLKDAKFELELLTQKKEILENFESASVSTCDTILTS